MQRRSRLALLALLVASEMLTLLLCALCAHTVHIVIELAFRVLVEKHASRVLPVDLATNEAKVHALDAPLGVMGQRERERYPS